MIAATALATLLSSGAFSCCSRTKRCTCASIYLWSMSHTLVRSTVDERLLSDTDLSPHRYQLSWLMSLENTFCGIFFFRKYKLSIETKHDDVTTSWKKNWSVVRMTTSRSHERRTDQLCQLISCSFMRERERGRKREGERRWPHVALWASGGPCYCSHCVCACVCGREREREKERKKHIVGFPVWWSRFYARAKVIVNTPTYIFNPGNVSRHVHCPAGNLWCFEHLTSLLRTASTHLYFSPAHTFVRETERARARELVRARESHVHSLCVWSNTHIPSEGGREAAHARER